MTDRTKRYWPGLTVLIGLTHVVLLVLVFEQRRDMVSLQRRVSLLHGVQPGGSQDEIVVWLGKPARIEQGILLGGRPRAYVMVYPSSPSRPNGPDDIWVVLDEKKVVEAVYYPDLASDRVIREDR